MIKSSQIKRHFTLVELLVVILVIGTLMSLLLPSLKRSRARARKTNCISNLKQIGIFTELYRDDNDSYFPDAYRRLSGGDIRYWSLRYDGSEFDFSDGALGAYVNSPHVFRCPEFIGSINPIDPDYGQSCGYGMNAEYIGGSPAGNENAILNADPAKITQIKDPAGTFLYMDSAVLESANPTESFYFWPRFNYTSGSEQSARSHYRHMGLAVGLFCDGHTEDSKQPDAISSPNHNLGWPKLSECDRE